MKLRIDFIGVGFGRTGSNWLVNCLYEHPQISIPKFNLLTEINYFPEEYEIMGLKNYYKKFKNCDFSKVVGEISTLIIDKKRSAKLLKKLFPNTKIIIYERNEEDRAKSYYNVSKYHDLLPTKKPKFNQKELIEPWKKEFGKNVFIFNMDNQNKQGELNKLFKFLGVKEFTPYHVDKRLNESYKDRKKGITIQSTYPRIRKIINILKPRLRKHKRLYYTIKRTFNVDYNFQKINHKI